MSPGGVLGGTGATGITVQAGPLKPGVARISGGVMAGQMVNKVQPVYPPVARAAHMGGTVVMHAIISKQGTVESLEVASSTNPLFNNAALDAVKQWQYKPYLLNGEPTEVDTTITVNFNLGGPPAAPGGAPAAAPAPAVPPS
jgi:protein TonB